MEKMMTKEFDPMDGLSQDDLQYLQKQRDAFARQRSVHDKFSGDPERAAAAEAHRRSVMEANGVTPPEGGLMPPPPSVATPSPAMPAGVFSVLRAVPETDGGTKLPPTTEQYAPDWKHLKERIAGHDGTWIVSRHEFVAHVAFILGFFGKDGWEPPPDSEKERFEVIVKDNRVFRSDPE